MRDLLRFVISGSAEKAFGGKTIVLGFDFKQILHVIPKATRPVVVGANINSSYIHVDKLQDIGDGIARVVNTGSFEIDISALVLFKCGHNPIATIVESTFPSSRYDMFDESQLEGRAILSPTLDLVDQINQYMCDMNTTEG
ncbi:PREDICTED: uncharacterized protein LOC109180728 [Ipomoea nil]|uniref:uncharacterized protein LOC109180728 n=1 Tax=Ipomoea nil TaxID=35883 RepID=UPI000900E437|nr:PREDICTED: uncharacterized protein LOC109180728 [Ipomoea nil]